jgi:D-alanyl-D-alanine carboxypeptidase/D-alanyl-D-alanine-endopeptidase (penicillin-binding protein 4)
MARLLAVLLTCCGILTVQAATDTVRLPPPVQQALKNAGIPSQAVAVVTQPLGKGSAGLRHQADVPMNPASLMKLLTTLAALETLGPAHVWRTEVLATTTPENEVLAGDLYLRGSGDPKLTYDRLWLLLRELRGRGLREIRGDLVLDRTAFAPTEHDPAAFDGKPLRPYNVGADALLFNFATLHLTLWPNSNGSNGVRVLGEPLPAGFEIVNRLQLTDNPQCGEWRERLEAKLVPGQLTLSGGYPRVCGEKRWHLAGVPNASLLHGVFTRLWRELGGQFAGQVRFGTAPPTAMVLAASESPTLGEIVRDINKYSNNVMAQQLFLTLGGKVGAGGTALTPATAETAVRNWLTTRAMEFPELIIDNGAGLSRRSRISADSLARLLAAGWASPAMPEYLASLPIAAIDGTLKKKLNGNSVAGQAHLKTGSLEGVRGIAGYLLDRNGQRHLVVFMVNHPKANEAQPAFDALLEWLWAGAY